LFVFNNIISGLDSPSSGDNQEALREVLECYLGLVKKRDNEELIEGVGILCQKLGDTADTGLVIGTLVSSVKTENEDIRNSLHHSLVAIADGRGLSVQNMMEDNLDLLYTDLNIKLRHKDCLSHFGVRMMIGMVMRTSSNDQKMTELQDTIEYLLRHLAVAEEEATLQILVIVQEFVRGMSSRMESVNTAGAIENQKEDGRKGLISRMILELEEERRKDEALAEEMLKCPEEGFHKDDNEEDAKDDETEDDSDPPEIKTDEQRWLETVITHCRHYVSMTGQPRWQMTAITIVSTCLRLLSSSPGQGPGQRQSVILPLVHLAWAPLKQCFSKSSSSTNLFLMDTAFQCVMTIARVSRDFVHSRTVKDVFPGLLKFLTSVKAMLDDKEQSHSLMASQSRRVLARLVTGVWSLCELLDLSPLETEPWIQLVLDTTGPELIVKGGETGQMMVTRESAEGQVERLTVRETGPGEVLVPSRNVDKNILWLKMNHAN